MPDVTSLPNSWAYHHGCQGWHQIGSNLSQMGQTYFHHSYLHSHQFHSKCTITIPDLTKSHICPILGRSYPICGQTWHPSPQQVKCQRWNSKQLVTWRKENNTDRQFNTSDIEILIRVRLYNSSLWAKSSVDREIRCLHYMAAKFTF